MNENLVNLIDEHAFYHNWGCACGWDDITLETTYSHHLAQVLTDTGYDHNSQRIDTLTRVEVIGQNGRYFVKYDEPGNVSMLWQDNNRTLKIFMKGYK